MSWYAGLTSPLWNEPTALQQQEQQQQQQQQQLLSFTSTTSAGRRAIAMGSALVTGGMALGLTRSPSAPAIATATSNTTHSRPLLHVFHTGRSTHTGGGSATAIGMSTDCDQRMPLLYSLARNWAWAAVTFRCQSHPEEAASQWRDYLGDTVLHWTVFGKPPISAVQSLLDVNPELAQIRNKKGLLPLHVACSYRASADVIRALLDVYPEAAGMATAAGSYPLHLLCDYGCEEDTLAVLLSSPHAVPQTVTALDTHYQQRPLALLNARKNMNEFGRMVANIRQARNRQRTIRRQQQQQQEQQQQQQQTEFGNQDIVLEQLDDFVASFRNMLVWRKVLLLIVAEYLQRPLQSNEMENVTPSLILRAAVTSLHCPESLQELAILLYASDLMVADEQGDVPLHVAARSFGSIRRPLSLLKELVTAQPHAAAVRNHQGQTPLQALLEAQSKLKQQHHQQREGRNQHHGTSPPPLVLGWSDGIGLLLEADPTQAGDFNVPTNLYPGLLYRMGSASTGLVLPSVSPASILYQALHQCHSEL